MCVLWAFTHEAFTLRGLLPYGAFTHEAFTHEAFTLRGFHQYFSAPFDTQFAPPSSLSYDTLPPKI